MGGLCCIECLPGHVFALFEASCTFICGARCQKQRHSTVAVAAAAVAPFRRGPRTWLPESATPIHTLPRNPPASHQLGAARLHPSVHSLNLFEKCHPPRVDPGLWLSRESVGDAGANHLGYFTAGWAPGGDAIMAHGFTGSLHMWKREEGGWVPQVRLSTLHRNSAQQLCRAASCLARLGGRRCCNMSLHVCQQAAQAVLVWLGPARDGSCHVFLQSRVHEYNYHLII